MTRNVSKTVPGFRLLPNNDETHHETQHSFRTGAQKRSCLSRSAVSILFQSDLERTIILSCIFKKPSIVYVLFMDQEVYHG